MFSDCYNHLWYVHKNIWLLVEYYIRMYNKNYCKLVSGQDFSQDSGIILFPGMHVLKHTD